MSCITQQQDSLHTLSDHSQYSTRGTKLLHKEELVPILWKALQDTINRVAVLEQAISSLMSRTT
jgi:hypothetical protein